MPFFCYRRINTLFEGGRRNSEKIRVPNRGYGVVIMPEPIYKYPEGHPCYGCVFTFKINKPSCLTGEYPDTENCINAFYKRMLSRQRAEHQTKLEKEG